VLEDHPDGPFTHFLWVTRSSVHDPILSNDGVSGRPGAIHLVGNPAKGRVMYRLDG